MVRPPCGRCLAAAALALAVTSLGLSARGAAPQILLLDFWSPQCGPCMQMKPIMHSFEQANYPIREIDTTRDFQTSQQFGVSRIPCFVMLVDGQEVDREIGYTSSERLQQMFEKAKEIVVQRHHARGQSPDALTQPGVVAGGNTAQGPAPRLETATSVQQQNWSQTAAATSPGGPTCPVQSPVETSAGSSSSDDFPPNLMAATVRIRVDDPQGARSALARSSMPAAGKRSSSRAAICFVNPRVKAK